MCFVNQYVNIYVYVLWGCVLNSYVYGMSGVCVFMTDITESLSKNLYKFFKCESKFDKLHIDFFLSAITSISSNHHPIRTYMMKLVHEKACGQYIIKKLNRTTRYLQKLFYLVVFKECRVRAKGVQSECLIRSYKNIIRVSFLL